MNNSNDGADGQVTVAQRLGHMALAITIGVSVAGFLIGVGGRPELRRPTVATADRPQATDPLPPEVVDYLRMTEVNRGPNANWKQSIPEHVDNPTRFYGDKPPTEAERAHAVTLRAERRAFSGAPPVVPHAIDERNAQACMSCHGAGLKVGSVVAPKMSHHYLQNCTQCHVEGVQDAPWSLASTAPQTTFVGLPEPGRGERAGPGAPPTVPHPLWMRSDCASCHGELGKSGLRSSHPWRTNCTQCHAPTRGFDWAPLDVPPLPTREEQKPTGAIARAFVQ